MWPFGGGWTIWNFWPHLGNWSRLGHATPTISTISLCRLCLCDGTTPTKKHRFSNHRAGVTIFAMMKIHQSRCCCHFRPGLPCPLSFFAVGHATEETHLLGKPSVFLKATKTNPTENPSFLCPALLQLDRKKEDNHTVRLSRHRGGLVQKVRERKLF